MPKQRIVLSVDKADYLAYLTKHPSGDYDASYNYHGLVPTSTLVSMRELGELTAVCTDAYALRFGTTQVDEINGAFKGELEFYFADGLVRPCVSYAVNVSTLELPLPNGVDGNSCVTFSANNVDDSVLFAFCDTIFFSSAGGRRLCSLGGRVHFERLECKDRSDRS